MTAINRQNREIRDYRSVHDDPSRSVDERVFTDVSKDTVSQFRFPQAEHPSTVTDDTQISVTGKGGKTTAYCFFITVHSLLWGRTSFSRLHDHTQNTPHWVGHRCTIRPSHTTLPDNTQHSQETNINVPGRIRTRNPRKRVAQQTHALVGAYYLMTYNIYKEPT